MAGRGRPRLAALSLDAALEAVRRGTAPNRPRNEFERQAGGKRRGRRPSDTSATKQAAMLAKYFIDTGMPPTEACRRARVEAQPTGAAPIDRANLRKYLKRESPTVLCLHNGGGLFAGFPKPAPELRPVLAAVEDASPE